MWLNIVRTPKTLKAFYRTAVERLTSQKQLLNFHAILDVYIIF